MTAVAVLGAGALGAAIPERLVETGHAVTLWNRTPATAAEVADRIGARAVDTAADAVRDAAIVLTVLRDGAAVESVLRGVGDAFAPGAVWVQASTVGIRAAGALRSFADTAGIPLLDAPVSGSTGPARAGRLVWLVGGEDEVLARARPVLDALGATVLHVGERNEGSAVKLLVNAWMTAATVAMTDVLASARRLGVTQQTLTEAIGAGPLAMPYAMTKLGMIAEESFAPGFAITLALKDVDLLVDAVPEQSDLLRAVRDRLAAAEVAGRGRDDLAAVVAVAP